MYKHWLCKNGTELNIENFIVSLCVESNAVLEQLSELSTHPLQTAVN
jgi:hypothetical protein